MMGSDARYALKILIKKSNSLDYIELNIQNTKVPRSDDPII